VIVATALFSQTFASSVPGPSPASIPRRYPNFCLFVYCAYKASFISDFRVEVGRRVEL